MLAIEIDGGYHETEERVGYDNERTYKLNDKGISVLRFKNEEVFQNREYVISTTQKKILACCRVMKVKRPFRESKPPWQRKQDKEGTGLSGIKPQVILRKAVATLLEARA
jgi:hypothetical protein